MSKNTFSEDPHTKKQVLFNDIIKYLKNANCQWKNTEVASGNNLIQALTNTLWTIDGHHFVFSKQGFNLGYNCLTQKKDTSNTTYSTLLDSVSSHLFNCL